MSEAQEGRRSVLPLNLAASLRHLSEQDMMRLAEAVAAEMEYRGLSDSKQKRQLSGKNKPTPVLAELTRSQISLIRSSIRAGVKPAALSRQFGLTRAQITAALKAED
jgi:hypothetical protein